MPEKFKNYIPVQEYDEKLKQQAEQKEVLVMKVRWATINDLPRIFEIEKRSYPPYLQATHKILKERLDTFGILVAEDKEGKIYGFSTMVPAALPWDNEQELFRIIMNNRHPYYRPWLDQYKKGKEERKNFNTLWVMSTAVESKFQNKGVGGALIEASLRIAKEKGLSYRASALKCEYATKKLSNETIEHYIERVKSGEVKDRFLQPYIKRSFQLSLPLPNYEPDHPSRRSKLGLNYNILAYKKIE